MEKLHLAYQYLVCAIGCEYSNDFTGELVSLMLLILLDCSMNGLTGPSKALGLALVRSLKRTLVLLLAELLPLALIK